MQDTLIARMDTQNEQTPPVVVTNASTITVELPVTKQEEMTSRDIPSDAPQSVDPVSHVSGSEGSVEQPVAAPHSTNHQELRAAVPAEPIQGEVIETKPKHPGGRPSKYNDEMLAKAKAYYHKCLGNIDNKKRMPLLEELARLCDVHGETLENWCEENEEFFETIKKLKELQKERIVQIGFGAKNPTFAIFMLKANHGMIETEKRILAGQQDAAPMSIQVTDYKGAQQIPAQAAQVIEEGSE